MVDYTGVYFCHFLNHIISKFSVSSSFSPLRLWTPWRQVPCPTSLYASCSRILALSKGLANVMGALRRGCGCYPRSWQLAKTGGVCVVLMDAESTGSLLQDEERVLCQWKWKHTCHMLLLGDCTCVSEGVEYDSEARQFWTGWGGSHL